MKHIIRSFFTLAALAVLAVSCGKQTEEATNAAAKRYFDAWRAINYPDAVEKDGIYIIEDKAGTGLEWTENLPVSFATYTIRSLGGTVSSNTDEAWARQLGQYNQTYYYGQQVILTGENVSYAGIDIMLDGMREGGTRTAIIPSWMMTYDRYDTAAEYLEHESDVSSAIYTITFLGQTANLAEYEYTQMLDYAQRNWSTSDTLSTGAVFFKSHTVFDEEPVEMPSDTIVYINYTGRRMDGQVFDTTIADTAKFYNIYNASKTYSPVSVTWAESADDLTMGDSSSLIDGFKIGLFAMHADESASFLFGYNLGYGSSGSGNLVPAYAALRFDIEMVPEP